MNLMKNLSEIGVEKEATAEIFDDFLKETLSLPNMKIETLIEKSLSRGKYSYEIADNSEFLTRGRFTKENEYGVPRYVLRVMTLHLEDTYTIKKINPHKISIRSNNRYFSDDIYYIEFSRDFL